MEPRAAVAEWEGDKLTVWTGSQNPFGVRGELAAALNVPGENVRVIVPDTGGGFGGKHTRRSGGRSGPPGAGGQAALSPCAGRAKRNSPGPISARRP